MERVFWAACPACDGRFYANFNDMRHSGVRLMCPHCHARFLPADSPALDERSDEDDPAAAPTG